MIELESFITICIACVFAYISLEKYRYRIRGKEHAKKRLVALQKIESQVKKEVNGSAALAKELSDVTSSEEYTKLCDWFHNIDITATNDWKLSDLKFHKPWFMRVAYGYFCRNWDRLAAQCFLFWLVFLSLVLTKVDLSWVSYVFLYLFFECKLTFYQLFIENHPTLTLWASASSIGLVIVNVSFGRMVIVQYTISQLDKLYAEVEEKYNVASQNMQNARALQAELDASRGVDLINAMVDTKTAIDDLKPKK